MKYRFIYNTVLASVMLLAAAGCEKYLDTSLDQYETDQSTETTRNTVWNYGNAFYTPIAYGYTALDSNLFAAASDEAQQTAAQSNANFFNQGVINANINPMSYVYSDCYEGIRAANWFLEYTANGKGEEMMAMNRDIVNDRPNYERDLENLHYYQAEAHIARAYYYAELIKHYGGVPVVESQYEAGKYIQRSSYEDVVEYIVKEIDNYKDALAVDWSSYSERNGRFTLGAALAIKARVLLYAASPLHNPDGDVEKWKRAAAAAYDLISNDRLVYSLDSDYGAYFQGNRSLTSSETIYVVRRGTSNDPERHNYPIATQGGASGVTPTHDLVEAYEYLSGYDMSNPDPYADRDPRLAASIVTNGSTWNGRTINQSAGGSDDQSAANASRTGYYLKKFLTDNLNLTQGATAQHNWVAYRYGEVLLNYAEAMNEAYGPDSYGDGYALTAREAVQIVRDRASTLLPAVTASSKGDFRAAVKHERRVELAFEDHRYWDLLRWKDAMDVLNKPVHGVKVEGSESAGWRYTTVVVAERKFLERNYYMPFTRSEVENSHGTLTQNSGY